MKLFCASLLLVFLFGLSACSLNKFTADRTASLMTEAAHAFNSEPDLVLAREAMPGNLKMIEGLSRVSPNNALFLQTLAQGYCSYTFAFLEDNGNPADQVRARALNLRGYRYGLRSLPESVQEEANKSLEGFEKAVADLDDSDIPSLFWTAYCLGNWVNLNKTEVSAIAELSRAEIMMRKVLEKDERFFHGTPHIFYGVFYGARPKMLGGNPTKAREHLEKAIQISEGRFLLAKVFLAQFYAVPVQDEAFFKKTLQEVLDAPADILPEENLANAVAKQRAAKLLASAGDLF